MAGPLTSIKENGHTMINPKEQDILEYGMNLFGNFVSTEAKHDLVTDKVEIKLVFNNSVYRLEASYEDLRTEQGCANAWGQLILRCMINHERGVNQIQASDAQIKEMLKPTQSE